MSEYTITYTYDNFNRVIRKERSDGAYVDLRYDAQGRLTHKFVSKPAADQTIEIKVKPDWKAIEKEVTSALMKELRWVR